MQSEYGAGDPLEMGHEPVEHNPFQATHCCHAHACPFFSLLLLFLFLFVHLSTTAVVSLHRPRVLSSNRLETSKFGSDLIFELPLKIATFFEDQAVTRFR